MITSRTANRRCAATAPAESALRLSCTQNGPHYTEPEALAPFLLLQVDSKSTLQARFAKRRTIFAVHVQKKVCGDGAANSACEMTAPAKVHLEASRALRPCFRNKRCPQSTAGGCSERFCSMLARSLGHRLAVSSNVTARFGLTLYELACADTKIVCVRSLAASGRAFGCADFGAGLCFFCAASSFYRLTECIEFNAVCSSALRSMC